MPESNMPENNTPESNIAAALNEVPELNGKNYPLIVPEGVRAPFAVFSKDEEVSFPSLTSNGGLRKSAYRVDILADGYGTIKSLAEQAATALYGMEDGLIIQAVFVDENQPEGYEPSISLMRKTVNFRIIYEN